MIRTQDGGVWTERMENEVQKEIRKEWLEDLIREEEGGKGT